MSRPLARRALTIICVVMAATFATQTMVATLAPLLAVSLGATPATVGLLVSMGAVLPLLLATLVGVAVDRFGPVRLIVLGSIGLAAAPVLVAVSPSLGALAVTQALVGLFHLMLVVAAQAYVAGLGSHATHEKNFGWYTTFLSVGQLIGPLTGGFIANSHGFPAAFAASSIIAIVAAALTYLLPRVPSLGPTPRSTRQVFEALAEVLKSRGATAAVVVSTCLILVLSAYQAFFPVHLELLGYPASAIGAFIGARALAAILVRPFISRIVSFCSGRKRAFLLALALTGMGLLVAGIAVSTLPLGAASAMLGIGLGLGLPLSMVATVEHVAAGSRGTALGLRLTGNYAALVLGPLLLGVMAEGVGVRGTLVFSGLLVVPAVVLLLRVRSEQAGR